MLGRKMDAERAADESRARTTALALLAMREHGSNELREKLLRKGFVAEVTDRVVAQLSQSNQLSDERYSESFIRHHADRGQGPVRIRAALREAGVQDELVQQNLDAAQVDWLQLARSVRSRKFGTALPSNFRERAKQARFLQYRGFTATQIRAALGSDVEDDLDGNSEPDT